MKQFTSQKKDVSHSNAENHVKKQQRQELFGNSAMKEGMGEGGSRSQKWGTEMDSFNGVIAYSNGSDSGVHPNARSTEEGETRYGLKYQCVEYVNRYSALANGTGNMMGTGNAIDYAGSRGFGYTWIENKKDDNLPQAGDIIVFKGGSWGHVAIATGSSGSSVGIIQQNTNSVRSSIGIKEGKVQNWGSLQILGWQTQNPAQASSGTPRVSEIVPENTQQNNNAGASVYTVQAGDTLWKIAAQELGDGNRYPEIVALNNIANPSAISVGQVLRLKAQETQSTEKTPKTPKTPNTAEINSSQKDKALFCFAQPRGVSQAREDNIIQRLMERFQTFSNSSEQKNTSVHKSEKAEKAEKAEKKPSVALKRTYVVQKGDTLWDISDRELGDGHRYSEIAILNNIENPSAINVGQQLTLPS